MSMKVVEQSLAEALAAPSDDAACEALCRAWRALPVARVGAAARALAARVPRDSVAGANQKARDRAWLELADAEGFRALPMLLATPWSRQVTDALARLAVFERLGPDPRVVGALLELDTGRRFEGPQGAKLWVRCYELLLSWGASEAASRVQDAAGAAHSPWAQLRQRDVFQPLVERWTGRWPVEPELSPLARDRLAKLDQRIAGHAEVIDALVEAVRAAPRDDGPRVVLADALSERNDPRGEFIALQLEHEHGRLSLAQRERMQRLLVAAGSRWFDGLEGQVAATSVFSRGFLREVQLETRAPDVSRAAWRTVEEIETAGLALSLAPALAAPTWSQVRSLRGLSAASFESLVRSDESRAFELLEVERLPSRLDVVPRWSAQWLRLRADLTAAVWWVIGSALRSRVRGLQLVLRAPAELDRLSTALQQLDAGWPELQTVQLEWLPPSWPEPWAGEWSLEVRRVGGSRLHEATVRAGKGAWSELARALLSAEAWWSKVTVATSFVPSPLARQQLTSLLEPLGKRVSFVWKSRA